MLYYMISFNLILYYIVYHVYIIYDVYIDTVYL